MHQIGDGDMKRCKRNLDRSISWCNLVNNLAALERDMQREISRAERDNTHAWRAHQAAIARAKTEHLQNDR